MTETTPTADNAAIRLTDVTRMFGDVTAVDELDMCVSRGEIYGFLGPNGAGKTTTIGMLVNFLRPSSGRVRVFGHDPQTDELTIKNRTGILSEGFTPYPKLSGLRHVELACQLHNEDEPLGYLERVGLADDAEQKAGGYSRGMTRQLGLAMALVGDPDLLILDEPIAGLDPLGAARVKEIIEEENTKGATVFFSSHQLGHVQAVCDRVEIIQDGSLVREAQMEELLGQVSDGATIKINVNSTLERVPETVEMIDGVTDAWISESDICVKCSRTDVRSDVVIALSEAGIEVVDFETETQSLEDVFTAVMD
ncbi:ABC transporter ATP-binding protein [Halogeometricum borinquense]|uniref:ABC transporter ATP-binding protein n=1 Tax=Halogeometricum borinquense TaxID=60847 RepID=A0A6C0UQ26_9EURY|nr:ABC transporter ATP-binding protein [Halogeometricum borinquense]QIB75979.1 ABC transporter ATP-binding protein [Halogeometricum borinquense]